jgi:hypothetical protein
MNFRTSIGLTLSAGFWICLAAYWRGALSGWHLVQYVAAMGIAGFFICFRENRREADVVVVPESTRLHRVWKMHDLYIELQLSLLANRRRRMEAVIAQVREGTGTLLLPFDLESYSELGREDFVGQLLQRRSSIAWMQHLLETGRRLIKQDYDTRAMEAYIQSI